MYPEGTEINLLVNPNDNTRILFDTATDKWQVPLICVSAGIIGLILIFCFATFSIPIVADPVQESIIETLDKDSTFKQLPQSVKDSVLSLINNH